MKLVAYDIQKKQIKRIQKIFGFNDYGDCKVLLENEKVPLIFYGNMTNGEVYLLRESSGGYIKLSDNEPFTP